MQVAFGVFAWVFLRISSRSPQNRTIGVNLGIFHRILTTVDINMPPLQGWILLLDVFL